MRLAIVHDYLTQYGGAERVLESMSQIWGEVKIYTSIYDREKLGKQGFHLENENVVYESFMRKFPLKRKFAQSYYLPFYPLAFENFKFDDLDVVISNTSYAAKGVITKPETLHICYCCTPTRHLWYFQDYVKKNENLRKTHRIFLKPVISYLRVWDQIAAQRVDKFIAISTIVKKRIEQVYRRESEVIFPPVDIEKFKQKKGKVAEEDYFLIVSRLNSHKRVDLAIEAFNRMKDKRLVIIGGGSMESVYKKTAGENIIFKGRLTDPEVVSYYQNCLGFIYPQEEDFGITAVEAQAAGKGVICYGEGGVLDTVIDGKTGVYFEKQKMEDLIEAVSKFDQINISEDVCKKNALKFSKDKFKNALEKFVEKSWEKKLEDSKI